jgi:hypothetical protein
MSRPSKDRERAEQALVHGLILHHRAPAFELDFRALAAVSVVGGADDEARHLLQRCRTDGRARDVFVMREFAMA